MTQICHNMNLYKVFSSCAVPLMLRQHELEKNGEFPATNVAISERDRKDVNDFKSNIELYTVRLEHAGTRFSVLTWFGRYYVWIQSYAFPICLCAFAVYLLLRYGTFTPPVRL